MSDGDVKTTVQASVGNIWLARPAKRNALNVRAIESLIAVLKGWKNDPTIRAITLRGEGAAFCSGADIGHLRHLLDGGVTAQRQFLPLMEELILAFRQVGKPCIAGVHGNAYAGGFVLVLLCDVVIATEDSRFSVPEIKIGMWPLAVSVLLKRVVGSRKALDIMLFGDPFDAADAERLGIVTRLVAADKLESEVEATAARLASQSASTMRIGRDALLAMDSMSIEQSMALMRELMPVLMATPDAREGISAFLEHRVPTWS